MREVPVRHIVTRIAQDQYTVENARKQVNPALVGKEMAGDIDPAVREATVAPPAQRCADRRVSAKGQEAEIVYARLHYGEIRRLLIIQQRFQEVRNEYALVRAQSAKRGSHRAIQSNIWIEI